MADCVLCRRPQADTAYTCPRCTGRVHDALGRLAELAAELDVTIARLGRGSQGGAGADRHPLPVDLAAAADADAVTNTVTTWARHCAEERGAAAPPYCGRGDLGEVASWLAGQLEWLRHQPEAAEALDELEDACALAVRVVDRHTSGRWYAGPCGAQIAHAPAESTADGPTGAGEGDRVGKCSADLYGRPGAVVIVCGACGARHDAAERRDWLLDVAQDQLWHAEMVGRALAALGVDVTGARLRTWAARGLIVSRGVRVVDDRSGRTTGGLPPSDHPQEIAG